MQAADTALRDPSEIVTTGLIPAPREKVFRALAEPQRLARRWGPEDFHQA